MKKYSIEDMVSEIIETITKKNDERVSVWYGFDFTERKIIDIECDDDYLEFLFDNGYMIIPREIINQCIGMLKEDGDITFKILFSSKSNEKSITLSF